MPRRTDPSCPTSSHQETPAESTQSATPRHVISPPGVRIHATGIAARIASNISGKNDNHTPSDEPSPHSPPFRALQHRPARTTQTVSPSPTSPTCTGAEPHPDDTAPFPPESPIAIASHSEPCTSTEPHRTSDTPRPRRPPIPQRPSETADPARKRAYPSTPSPSMKSNSRCPLSAGPNFSSS